MSMSVVNVNLKVILRKTVQDMVKTLKMKRVRKTNPMKETTIASFLAGCLVLLLQKKIIISITIFFTPEA